MTQFQEMSRNYLTPDNHKSKAYQLHTGRQLTGNANSLKETYIFDLILCCYATATTVIYRTVPKHQSWCASSLHPKARGLYIVTFLEQCRISGGVR
jgi:hypothetical protein